MSLLEAIILGVLQGLTEFLPVSSSGHLVIAQKFLGLSSQGLFFSVVVHVATLAATCIVFRAKIKEILVSLCKSNTKKTPQDQNNTKVFIFIMITTIVTGILGLLLKDFFEAQFDSTHKVAFFLACTGIILFLPTLLRTPESKENHQFGKGNAVILGLAQTLAILPGISRSGTTIVASLLLGLKRKDAGEMAFLISIPIILAALLLEILEIPAISTLPWIQLTAAFIAAFVSGWIALHHLLKWIRNGKLHYFAFYCWLVAILLLVF